MERRPHTGWRSRGYLTHYDAADAYQHVVFRLHDSLPPAMETQAGSRRLGGWFTEMEAALDAGRGERWLGRPDVAEAVEATIRCFDGTRFGLEAWCVMPTHVHVLVRQFSGYRLQDVVGGWKSVSGRRANLLVGRTGRFWALDYFDRVMRDERQLAAAHAYIEANPVSAGLCSTPEAWRWGSARLRAGTPAVRSAGGSASWS
jgi:putative transposase